VRRLHLHSFPLFLGVVLGLAAAVVAVFVATAGRPAGQDRPPGREVVRTSGRTP
jgi:hypothetical protein